MPKHQWVSGRKTVNAPVQVPVHVAAADPNRPELYDYFVWSGIRRQRHLSNFERALSDKLDGFQTTTLAD
jgi:hypothetical protein